MSPAKKQLDNIRKKKLNKIRNKSRNIILSSPDNPLMIIIFILIMFGIMAIFSAGAPEGIEFHNNSAYFVIKHILFLLLGGFFMIRLANYDYQNFKKLDVIISLVTLFLIILTFIPGIGKTANGSTRWIYGLPVQPSELAKISCILLMSSALSEAKSLFDEKFMFKLGLVGAMVGLILIQPNLSVAMMIATITFVLLITGGVSSWLLGTPVVFGSIFVYFHILANPYQLKRITGWLNPWADPQGTGYNLIQSWYAIGSGGLFGVGFGNSKQKLFWLPFRHTDFIFSVIAEELGFIACVFLIGLFIAFIYRGFLIASRCPDIFGKLVATGITYTIGIQAFINIAVTTGVMPVTGVPLPLISYGGSSVVVTMMLLGILLNISRKRIKKIQGNETVNEYQR